MLITQAASALGLGELRLESHLNQPLRVLIPLHGMQGLEPDQIHARLADVAAYQRLGLGEHDRPRDLRFEVAAEGLWVLGERPLRRPVMELVIELSWPGGRLLRGYPLLLDPAPLDSAAEIPLPRQVTVERGDSLGSIAQSLVEGSDINPTQMMLALHRANPRAFTRGDINAIKLGARLKVPSLAAVRGMDAESARRSIYGGYVEEERPEPEATPEPEPAPEPQPEPESEPQLEILVLDEERVMRMEAPELQRQLARVKENNRRVAEENARLEQRLAGLERRLRRVSERLLAKPVVVAKPEIKPEPEPAPVIALPPPVVVEESSDSTLLITIAVLLAMLVMGIGGYIWQQRRWDFYKEI